METWLLLAEEKAIRYRPAYVSSVTTTDNVRLNMILMPKNWAVFQHYKDRCPPWIKLHRDLLNDRVYMGLPLASKAIAPLMWLLASESKNGHFDGSLDELVFRLHITAKEYSDGVKPLINKGFFVVASKVLADSKQDAIPETETETEGETEGEAEAETKKRQIATIVASPDGVSLETWDAFVKQRKSKKAQITELVLKGIKKEADKAGWSMENALKEVVIRNWQSFKAEWVKESNLSKTGQMNKSVMSGLTRGLIGGGSNVKFIDN